MKDRFYGRLVWVVLFLPLYLALVFGCAWLLGVWGL